MQRKGNLNNGFECRRLVMDEQPSKLLFSHLHRITERYHWEELTIFQLKSRIEQTVSYFDQMFGEKHFEEVCIATGKIT